VVRSIVYYIEQDNTVWCCEADCGPYYEQIDKSFVECSCEHIEPRVEADMSEHLQSCAGGGPVLKWREAKPLEQLAFMCGKDNGSAEGWFDGVEYQKKQVKG
jgi:hypothetical protein